MVGAQGPREPLPASSDSGEFGGQILDLPLCSWSWNGGQGLVLSDVAAASVPFACL